MRSSGGYDYFLYLFALKHVRSEKDPFTLMRMVDVNIVNTNKTVDLAQKAGARKYFCVSTDMAANPVNMMGASKSIMELYLMHTSLNLPISTARFANAAFSDGSLLCMGLTSVLRSGSPYRRLRMCGATLAHSRNRASCV
jgi:FlaA1/EpsC-like NDP-sugar epimerase